MRINLLAALLLLCSPVAAAGAQNAMVANVAAQDDPGAISLYPGDTAASSGDEIWTRLGSLTVVRNVTHPTLTPILPPQEKATGAAVILAPGGGMIFLSMPSAEITHALTERGIAVFVLKYRVVHTPPAIPQLMVFLKDMQERAKRGEVILPNPSGDADAHAAVALVRANAAKWGIDPEKVGLMGFSSGAQVSRDAALSGKTEGRPSFVGLIYGAMDAVEVPSTAPPMFAAIAMDDTTVASVGFPVVEAWRRAMRPVELHAYQTGGHGFAGSGPRSTSRLYMDQFIAWLDAQGFISSADKNDPR